MAPPRLQGERAKPDAHGTAREMLSLRVLCARKTPNTGRAFDSILDDHSIGYERGT